jgi:hypothetical protein
MVENRRTPRNSWWMRIGLLLAVGAAVAVAVF